METPNTIYIPLSIGKPTGGGIGAGGSGAAKELVHHNNPKICNDIL